MTISVQMALFQDDTKKKTIITVPAAELKLSQYNPRFSRSQDDIERLASRIARNGFEITRALWAYRNCDGYEVFAGGTRLEAARAAGVSELPIVLHDGFTDEEIVRLAELDNENDEYHKVVNPVDEWAHYAWLNEQGWTQERIATAKGLANHTLVSIRIKLNRLPDSIKKFVTQELIEEAHLREISSLLLESRFSDWLTTEQAWIDLTNKAVHDKSKNGSKTVKAVKQDVDAWKAFITEAESLYVSFSADTTLYNLDQDPPTSYTFDAKQAFIDELKKREARSLAKVKEAARAIQLKIMANLESYETYVREQSREAAQKALQAQREQELLGRFILGDCLEVIESANPQNIRLLLLDPPYGKDYQSNRRWKSKAPDKIENDTEAAALALLTNIIESSCPRLSDNAHVLVFCDWQIEPRFREILESAGLKVKGSLVWVKEEHSAGDVKGAFGPSHERILHAVKGSPEVTPRIRDVLEFARSNETSHPTEKPIKLLQALIGSTTHEGDLIVDWFAGCASSLVAARRLKREFLGTELSETYHEEGSARLLRELK